MTWYNIYSSGTTFESWRYYSILVGILKRLKNYTCFLFLWRNIVNELGIHYDGTIDFMCYLYHNSSAWVVKWCLFHLVILSMFVKGFSAVIWSVLMVILFKQNSVFDTSSSRMICLNIATETIIICYIQLF